MDALCLVETLSHIHPGQPAERSGPRDSSTVACQIQGEAQHSEETPAGRGTAGMNLLPGLPALTSPNSAEKSPNVSKQRIPQRSGSVSGVTTTLLLQQSTGQAIYWFNLIIYDNTSE